MSDKTSAICAATCILMLTQFTIEAAIISQILLSTFIYPIILMGVIKLFSQKFEAECAEEAHHH